MAYIGKSPSNGIRNRFIYTATAGQATFSGTDDHNRTLSYTDAEFTDVFLNGVKLDKSDYTATSGTSIVLDEAAAAGDTLEVLNFDTFSVFSGEFSQDVTVGGATTLSGDLTVDTNTLHVDSTNNRVGIGTSSAANKLEVSGAIVAQGAATAYTNTGLYLQNKGSSIFDVGAWRSGASAALLTFSTDSGSDAAPVERMRIGASGIELSGTLDMNNYDINGVDQIFHHGDTNTYMQFHAADQWRVVTGGNERFEIRNDGFNANSKPAFFVRTWCRWEQIGTQSIQADGNVSSITDGGVGITTNNFSVALSSANFAVAGGAGESSSDPYRYLGFYKTMTTTSVKSATIHTTTSRNDSEYNAITVTL